MTSAELAHIRAAIERQFLAHLKTLAPSAYGDFVEAGLEHYHRQSHRIDHAASWMRHRRVLPPDDVAFVQRSSMLRRLAAEFGTAEIVNEVGGTNPEVVWRLVRPNQANDVGPLHADRWFWEINKWSIPPGYRRVKIWTLVQGEPGRGGLRVVPGSHLGGPWRYEIAHRHGIVKPVFDEKTFGLSPKLLTMAPGESVVFSDDLLHGGAVTIGSICRVSFEFTIIVPEHRF
ncbi:MAG: phytanoyl-CoA dioxygenase family protein [Rhodospirillales bacterium]